MTYKFKLASYFSLLFIVFGIVFVGFQWHRERKFRREIFEARLEIYTDQLSPQLSPDSTNRRAAAVAQLKRTAPRELRITLIRPDGEVVYEYWHDARLYPDNQLHRPEVVRAFSSAGWGSDIRRSHTIGEEFFYYAKRYPQGVVRVALPYDEATRSLLQVDHVFIFFVLLLFPFVLLALMRTADHFGASIESLRRFVDSAERGLVDYDHLHFPSGELGRLGQQVVAAYRKAEEHRRQAEQERENRRRYKRQVSANITHELRTPVAAIQGYLETLLAHPLLPESQVQHFLGRALAQNRRLSALIRDVALITKVEEAADALPREPIDLRTVVDEAVDDLADLCASTEVKVEVQLPDTLPISGNQALLYAIFRNLLENSVRYAAPCRCWIRLLAATPTHLHLRFSDDGAGVAPEHLPHLFERFYRAEAGRVRPSSGTSSASAVRPDEGTGLGLAIVRNAVRFHGGDITTCAPETGGLAFDFSIERAHPAAS